MHVYRVRTEPAATRRDAEPLPLPDKPSIAVLPFTNMSADAEQDVFADGLTEDLITDLSRNAGLFVIARNSTFAYKGKSVDVRQIARDWACAMCWRAAPGAPRAACASMPS